MKNKYLFFLLAVFLTSIGGYTQSNFGFSGSVPLKENYAPLFGKDIIINDNPDRNQHDVAICSAFNGWLYAAQAYEIAGWPYITISRSEDNGISWTVLQDNPSAFQDSRFSTIDIIVTGDSISNLKLFMAFVISNSLINDLGEGYVVRYDGNTGVGEERLFEENSIYDIAMTSDMMSPSQNSNPFSIGVLYSRYSSNNDSLIFLSSSNGGISLNGRQVVASTNGHYHKVGLAYGKSNSFNSGRYFATWEERNGFGKMPGRIYTSHTEPNFNSPFTNPVNLDGLDPTSANFCENPSIACQYGTFDNDSSNLTEIVTFEKYKTGANHSELGMVYNLQAASTSHFNKLEVSDTTHNNLQPNILYNQYDSTFIMTYFDSTTLKLPFLKNNFQLRNPNNWVIGSSGYNDSINLSAPFPRVGISSILHQGVSVWIVNQADGKGIGMFDSQYSTWTGITENDIKGNGLQLSIYPNPCNSWVTIWFDLQKNTNVTIKAYTSMGQVAAVFTDQNYKAGKHELKCNVSNLLPGSYILKLQTDDGTKSTKLIVVR